MTKKQAIKWLKEERVTDTTKVITSYDIIQKLKGNRLGYIASFFGTPKECGGLRPFYLLIASLFEGKEKFQDHCYDYIVNVDKSVSKIYRKSTLEDFIAFYCKELSSGGYIIKPGMSHDTIFTVLYYLSQHDYFFLFDDYSGSYEVRRVFFPIKLEVTGEIKLFDE